MKLCSYLTSLLPLAAAFCVTCTTDVSGPGGDGVNLISNSSFVNAGKQSLVGWATGDSSTVSLSTDAPSGGGTWSLQLVPGWIPAEGFARAAFSLPIGVQVLQLTLWGKLIGTDSIGTFGLGTIRNGEWVAARKEKVNSGSWKLYTLIDTLSVRAGDSLAVKLSAGSAELALPVAVRFDLVRVERVE